MNKINLKDKVDEILQMAQNSGAEQNYFFVTTFKRYQVQLQILEELQKHIKEDGTMVTKEYVKGRKNLYTNPAITEYNKTTVSANGTVQTLLKIITSLANAGLQGSADENDDPFS